MNLTLSDLAADAASACYAVATSAHELRRGPCNSLEAVEADFELRASHGSTAFRASRTASHLAHGKEPIRRLVAS